MIRIVVGDRHTFMCMCMKSVLDAVPGMDVVAVATDGRAVIDVVERCTPRLLIIDVVMPVLNGIEATRIVRARFPGVKVLALSLLPDALAMERAFDAGASGYELKDAACSELVTAVQTVLAGRKHIGRSLREMSGALPGTAAQAGAPGSTATLTAQECQILQSIAEGLSARQIASLLQLSAKTVEAHRQHIIEKTGVGTVAGLTKVAVRNGITSL